MTLRPAALLLALAAPVPALAQDAMGTIADGLMVSAPDMLMRAAVANCMIWDLDQAVANIQAGGWQGDTDDGGLTTLSMDEALAEINASEGWCYISSPVVSVEQAIAIASDLVVTAYGGDAIHDLDEDGCAMIYSDAMPDEYLLISSDGNDPTCENTGGGSAISY
jgi:hypothetical protein